MAEARIDVLFKKSRPSIPLPPSLRLSIEPKMVFYFCIQSTVFHSWFLENFNHGAIVGLSSSSSLYHSDTHDDVFTPLNIPISEGGKLVPSKDLESIIHPLHLASWIESTGTRHESINIGHYSLTSMWHTLIFLKSMVNEAFIHEWVSPRKKFTPR